MANWKKIGSDWWNAAKYTIPVIGNLNVGKKVLQTQPAQALTSAIDKRYDTNLTGIINKVSGNTKSGNFSGGSSYSGGGGAGGGGASRFEQIAGSGSATGSSYGDSGSSYGGSGGSSYSSGGAISPDALYDAEREAYLQKYNTAVEAAKNANAQDLKSLSDYIERFREDTKTKKERLEKSYDTQSSNLLKSIERFRDENAQNVADQRRAYLTNQAALESARAEADRQSRISAAARGLGGSGLQQLSQLQNLINQSQDISEVATENQTVMDNLRKALAEANQDYQDTSSKLEDSRRSDLADLDTALSRAEQDYTTNVQKANDNLRDLLAQYAAGKADNDVSALANLYNRVSSSSSGGGSGSGSSDGSLALSYLLDDFNDELDSIAGMTDKQLKGTSRTQLANEAYRTTLGNVASNAGNLANYNTARDALRAAIAAKNFDDDKKKSSGWNNLLNWISNG